MKKGGSVYILTNVHNQVLYTGVTSKLIKRISGHKEMKHDKSFSASYNADMLVNYKNYLTIEKAIFEEKRIKGGSPRKEEKIFTQRRKGIQRQDARQQNTILSAFAYLGPLRETK